MNQYIVTIWNELYDTTFYSKYLVDATDHNDAKERIFSKLGITVPCNYMTQLLVKEGGIALLHVGSDGYGN